MDKNFQGKPQVQFCLLNEVGNMKKTEKKDNNPGLNPIRPARGTWQKWGSVSRGGQGFSLAIIHIGGQTTLSRGAVLCVAGWLA